MRFDSMAAKRHYENTLNKVHNHQEIYTKAAIDILGAAADRSAHLAKDICSKTPENSPCENAIEDFQKTSIFAFKKAFAESRLKRRKIDNKDEQNLG